MSSNDRLAQLEALAETGIIGFATALEEIREQGLYPGAKKEPDAWPNYCKLRWSQTRDGVDRIIRAAPVLKRLRMREHGEMPISLSSAAVVSQLPEPVQDYILADPDWEIVRAKATAALAAKDKIAKNEARKATVEELIEAIETMPKPRKKPRKSRKSSQFIHHFGMGLWEIEKAADIANETILTPTENDWGWSELKKAEYALGRIRDQLTRPEYARDIDEEAAALLGDQA